VAAFGEQSNGKLVPVKHPALGATLGVPRGWKADMSDLGYRLKRHDAVINVGLLGTGQFDPKQYFDKLARVSNVKRVEAEPLNIDGETPPQALFELTHEDRPPSRSRMVLLATPQGWYVVGLDCPTAAFASHCPILQRIAASLIVPNAPAATAPASIDQPTRAADADGADGRHIEETLHVSCVPPEGWKRQAMTDGKTVRWVAPDGASLVQVNLQQLDKAMTAEAFGQAWEAEAIDANNKDNFKRIARNTSTVNGWPIYIGVYASDTIAMKNVYLAGPKHRVYVMSGIFGKAVVAQRVGLYDAFVGQFRPLGGTPPALPTGQAAGAAGPGPLAAGDGSFRLTVPQNMLAQRPQANTLVMSGKEGTPAEFLHIMVQSQGVVGDVEAVAAHLQKYREEVLRVRPDAKILDVEAVAVANKDLKGREFTAEYIADEQRVTQRVLLLRDTNGQFYTVVVMAPQDVYTKQADLIGTLVQSLEAQPAEE
jgi:hypothetical protein